MLTREVKSWMDEGVRQAREGKYQTAMELYDLALTSYPAYAEAWAWKAAAYAQLNLFQDALDCAEQAITADPRYEWGWFRKARTLESMGEPLAALGVYGRVLEINPDFRMAQQKIFDLKMKLGM